MLVRSLNRRGTILPKVALFATVVASAITLHAWVDTP